LEIDVGDVIDGKVPAALLDLYLRCRLLSANVLLFAA
jgi:hypothetical protein